jgi:hypothetical protein
MNRNRTVRAELDQLLREGELDADACRQLVPLYPLGAWDWRALGRWLLIFGALTAAAGVVILVREMLQLEFTLKRLAFALAVAMAALFAAGQALRRRGWPWSAQATELLGGLALIGESFVLGIIYSAGSGNWPALLLIDLLLLLALSYVLKNLLLLIVCAVVFFTWFGGATGYESGWGDYWFGMNYPLRFLGAALLIVAMGVAHRQAESGPLAGYRDFSKVWISAGLFLAEMALWLLSIFGNFGSMYVWHLASFNELLLFNVLWAALNLGLLFIGARTSYRMLRGYGATFFIIQFYTLFFTRVAESLGWVLSLFIAGGAAFALALWLERRRRARRSTGAAPLSGKPSTGLVP